MQLNQIRLIKLMANSGQSKFDQRIKLNKPLVVEKKGPKSSVLYQKKMKKRKKEPYKLTNTCVEMMQFDIA